MWLVARTMSASQCIIFDMSPTSIKQRDFARLLVGGGEGFFEASVPIAKLVTPPLFRLDALLSDGLTTTRHGH